MEFLWQDRKRPFLGLPLSFTKYSLDDKCLYVKTGVFTTTEDEIRLYRIIDVTLRRTLGQRILGIGTIKCHSSDESMKEFEIKHIKKPKETKTLLSDLVEEERRRNRVFSRESLDAQSSDELDNIEDIDDE